MGGQPARLGEPLQHERGVCHGDAREVLGAALEVRDDLARAAAYAVPSPSARAASARPVRWKAPPAASIVPTSGRPPSTTCARAAAYDAAALPCVPAVVLRRPAGDRRRAVPGQDRHLERADQPAPALRAGLRVRRQVGVAGRRSAPSSGSPASAARSASCSAASAAARCAPALTAAASAPRSRPRGRARTRSAPRRRASEQRIPPVHLRREVEQPALRILHLHAVRRDLLDDRPDVSGEGLQPLAQPLRVALLQAAAVGADCDHDPLPARPQRPHPVRQFDHPLGQLSQLGVEQRLGLVEREPPIQRTPRWGPRPTAIRAGRSCAPRG